MLVQASKQWSVYASTRSSTYPMPGVEWVQMDLEDNSCMERVVRSIRPYAIVHAAAMGNIDACQADREHAFRINAESTGFLAGLCAELEARMIAVSSDMVFDGSKGRYRETDPVNPVNYYGETKCAAEERVLGNCPNSVCGRAALIYGDPVFGGTSFSHQMLKRMEAGQPVTLFADQFRTPIEVRNLAEALLELAESDFTGILHLGGSERIDRLSFGRLMAEIRGFSDSLLIPARMGDFSSSAPRPADVSFDISMAECVLSTKLSGCREGMARG